MLDEIINIKFDSKFVAFEVYRRLPSIVEWENMLINREVSKKHLSRNIRGIYHLCKYLQVHPDNLTVDLVCNTLNEMKRKQQAGEEIPIGLYYSNVSKGVRSFFTILKGISGEILSSKGVDAKLSKNAGSFARQRVTKEQRDNLEMVLKESIKEHYHSLEGEDLEIACLEVLNIAKFMYYTGTRKTASCTLNISSSENTFNNDKWVLNVIDKGKRGGIKWEKILIGHALEDFKSYLCKRFNLAYDELETVASSISTVFPFWSTKSNDIAKVYGIALKRVGNNTTVPVHIWRHTFAQDFLEASDGNYELCASLGGWVSTHILKKHYGEMSVGSKIRGLRKAMGLPVEEIKYELRW
jgi:integrase